MKRSEMVERIAEQLWENERISNSYLPDWENCPSQYARGILNAANEALKAVEMSGMLPPLRSKIIKRDYTNSVGNLLENYEVEIAEWEPDEN